MPEGVALILGRVQPSLQARGRNVIVSDAGIVSGCDVVEAQYWRSFQHFVPLEMSVAGNAGVGRFTIQVGIFVRFDDIVAEGFTEINHQVVDTQFVTYDASVHLLRYVTASTFICGSPSGTLIVPQLKSDAYYFVSLFEQ
ncbi:hypothetical protein BMS3Bbin04_01384 [bacterium BMS3Bbin04]|nr:hypothetical protein BMS3Bbin04_01384 [bacterium BMS3Bbin04]